MLFDLVSPLTLSFNLDLIVGKGQYWRLLTSFSFSARSRWTFYFICISSSGIADYWKKDHFVVAVISYMLFIGAFLKLTCSVVMSAFTKIKFLGHPLAFMMVYVWARGAREPQRSYEFAGHLSIQCSVSSMGASGILYWVIQSRQISWAY